MRSLYMLKSINGDVIPDDLTIQGDLSVTGTLSAASGSFAVASNGSVSAVGLTVTGSTINLTSATTNNFIVKRYVSTAITQADLVGGAATQAINLTPTFPTDVQPIAAYVVTSVTTTSSNGSTTGLTAQIGPSADPDGYMTAISIFGAASRKATATAGVMLGCLRTADTPQILLTATGGAPDIGHINALSVKAVISYIEVAAE